VPALEEAGFLLAHGLLHLLGYDHATPEEDAIMTARTRELVDHERTLRAE
jgi:probable rRNA maturation factor